MIGGRESSLVGKSVTKIPQQFLSNRRTSSFCTEKIALVEGILVRNFITKLRLSASSGLPKFRTF
jgi:hypothetical protein